MHDSSTVDSLIRITRPEERVPLRDALNRLKSLVMENKDGDDQNRLIRKMLIDFIDFRRNYRQICKGIMESRPIRSLLLLLADSPAGFEDCSPGVRFEPPEVGEFVETLEQMNDVENTHSPRWQYVNRHRRDHQWDDILSMRMMPPWL